MTNVLISGVYPSRDAPEDNSSKDNSKKVNNNKVETPDATNACPFHAEPIEEVLKYSPTREDESMREALKLLKPIREDFRLADYAKSFNWKEISDEYHRQLPNFSKLPMRKEYSWYAVVFRSKRKVDCETADLFDADKMAYEEAFNSTNRSLLVYWYTSLDDDNNCLATCIWSSRDIARSVNSLPRHKEAAKLSAGSYVHYNIDRCRISWLPSQQKLTVSPW